MDSAGESVEKLEDWVSFWVSTHAIACSGGKALNEDISENGDFSDGEDSRCESIDEYSPSPGGDVT